MPKFRIKDPLYGDKDFTNADYTAFDQFDAAEQYCSCIDDDGSLIGIERPIEVRQNDTAKIYRVVIGAYTEVKYTSRSAREGE